MRSFLMQNNTTICKRHPLVSPQFANEEEEEEEEDDDDDDDGTIESVNAACAWIQPNGLCIYTHSMVKALGTSLQRHGYSAEENKILTTSLALPLLHETV